MVREEKDPNTNTKTTEVEVRRELFIKVSVNDAGKVAIRVNIPYSESLPHPPILEKIFSGARKCGRIETSSISHTFPEHQAMLMELRRIIGRRRIRKQSVYIKKNPKEGQVVYFELE